jgi:hypothetical protein
MVVACLGVVLACGGSATAGVLISGSQIADGSITGADVRDRSLSSRDLQAGALGAAKGPRGPRGLRGATGRPGADGPQGPVGATGARGPQGPQGTQGPAGQTGQQGPPGAAIAYAHVLADGGLDALRTKGMTVKHTATGLYCLVIDGDVHNLAANVDGIGGGSGGSGGSGAWATTAAAPDDTGDDACTGTETGSVKIYDKAGVLVDDAFYVTAN